MKGVALMQGIRTCVIVIGVIVLGGNFAIAKPHPRAFLSISKAYVTISPFAKKGLCRVSVRQKARTKSLWSIPMACKHLYAHLKTKLLSVPKGVTPYVDIEAALDIALNIRLKQGKIVSHRKSGFKDSFYVAKGSIDFGQDLDQFELLSKTPLVSDLDAALKEIERTLPLDAKRAARESIKKRLY